jgi:hypothetical protein
MTWGDCSFSGVFDCLFNFDTIDDTRWRVHLLFRLDPLDDQTILDGKNALRIACLDKFRAHLQHLFRRPRTAPACIWYMELVASPVFVFHMIELPFNPCFFATLFS